MISRFKKTEFHEWQKVFQSNPATSVEAISRAQQLRKLARQLLGCAQAETAVVKYSS